MAEAKKWPRVAVVGAGAVGGYFGGMLARAGAPVIFIGRPKFADAVKPGLGQTPVQPLSPETRSAVGKADLALVLGLDDAGFGGGG